MILSSNTNQLSVASQKDWFEFLLDLNLINKHLTQPNPEPNGCSLIVQFLYHANLTEQQYGHKNDQSQPLELKQRRINVLRILAIKAAALLNWNLQLFEKEIPVAVMSDLLQILLKITLKSDKPHLELNLDELEGYSLYCLQLLHRWCIRTTMGSKFVSKPLKQPQITAPGIVNPLQHMKEANENILKVLLQNVQDSIDFLEKFLNVNKELLVPLSDCFTNISPETGEYELIWSNGLICLQKEYKALIKYDLAKYFFQQQNYKKCLKLLQYEYENIKSLMVTNSYYNSYFNDCDVLIHISNSINEDTFDLDEIDNSPKVEFQSNLIIDKVEKSKKNEFKGILELLLEDNRKKNLSLAYRLDLEQQSEANTEALDQIASCNLVRLLQDDIFADYDLSKLNSISTAIIDLNKTTKKHQLQLIAYININFEKFNKKCQIELNDSFQLNLLSKLDSNVEMDSSPSSPIDTSIGLINDNSTFDCFKEVVAINEPMVLKNLISKYNQLTNNKGLRNFWPEAWNLSIVLSNLSQQYQSNVQNNLSKITNTNALDFFHICLAKVRVLVLNKNYESALKLLKTLEETIKESNYLSRFTSNLILLTNVKKYLNEYNPSKESTISKQNEQVIGSCKAFIGTPKSESDASNEMIRHVFVYLVTIGEAKYILGLNESKKQSASIYNGYLELCKKLLRFSHETNGDKNQAKKNSRDLWDCVVEIFSDSVQTKRSAGDSNQAQSDSTQIIRESSNACLTRESFCKFIKNLKIPQLLSILLSLLSTLYNVIDSSANHEITSEYRQYWPLSVSSSANINLNCLVDILNSLVEHCMKLDPYNSFWLRTIGDLSLCQSLLSDSIKYYLQVIINDTNYFFSNKNINRLMNEKLLKSMVKPLLLLNKNTHAALLCQYLPVIDYTTAFKCIQEKISIDETDLFYSCVWDVTLLEYLAYTNAQRSFNTKRDLAIKLLTEENINSSNPSDIHQKVIDFKRNKMLMLLIKHYLFCA